MPDPSPRPRNTSLDALAAVSVIGTSFALTVAVFGMLGWLLDRWLGTGPVLLLVGLAMGLGGGSWRFIRDAKAANRAAVKGEKTNEERGGPGAERR